MSLFSSIKDKIFGHKAAAPAPSPAPTPTSAPASAPAAAPTPAPAPAPTPAPAAQIDVGAVLSEMANMKGSAGNYQTSIVDLLKLLDLDSSLEARKQLGQELGVQAGVDGSAEQNIALHKAVMTKLAENGGVVPESLRGS